MESGINIGNVAGDFSLSAGGDIVAGNKTVIQNIINKIKPETVSVPYKFLSSYDISDRDIFFGRTGVINEILSQLSRHNIIVINGRSGSGKSSLINAGVIPALADDNYFYISLREYNEPLKQLSKEFKLSSSEQGAFFTLAVEIAQKKIDKLVIVFDQFERFFLNVVTAKRNEFISQFHNFIESSNFNGSIKFIFVLREEFLGKFVSEFETSIPTFFNVAARFNLLPLNKNEAREAILLPLKNVPNFGYDVKFVDEVLIPELLGQSSGENKIDPPHLQIVCNQLFEKAKIKFKEDLELGSNATIGFELYKELGKAEGILNEYLDDVVNRISANNIETRKAVHSILKLMIQTSGTRKFITYDLLSKGLPDFPSKETEQLIQKLKESRIIETRGENENASYSVSHEFMVEKVQSWFDERELLRKKAAETLERGLAEWESSGSLLNENQVNEIEKWIKDSLDEDAVKLINESRNDFEEKKKKEAELNKKIESRTKLIKTVIALALILSISLTIWAYIEKNNATTQSRISRAKELSAKALLVKNSDPTLTMKLAVASNKVLPNDDALSIFWDSRNNLPYLIKCGGVITKYKFENFELKILDSIRAKDSFSHLINFADQLTGSNYQIFGMDPNISYNNPGYIYPYLVDSSKTNMKRNVSPSSDTSIINVSFTLGNIKYDAKRMELDFINFKSNHLYNSYNNVNEVTISPHKKYVLFSNDQNKAFLVEAEKGNLIAELKGFKYTFWGLALFSDSGKFLLTYDATYNDDEIIVWDIGLALKNFIDYDDDMYFDDLKISNNSDTLILLHTKKDVFIQNLNKDNLIKPINIKDIISTKEFTHKFFDDDFSRSVNFINDPNFKMEIISSGFLDGYNNLIYISFDSGNLRNIFSICDIKNGFDPNKCIISNNRDDFYEGIDINKMICKKENLIIIPGRYEYKLYNLENLGFKGQRTFGGDTTMFSYFINDQPIITLKSDSTLMLYNVLNKSILEKYKDGENNFNELWQKYPELVLSIFPDKKNAFLQLYDPGIEKKLVQLYNQDVELFAKKGSTLIYNVGQNKLLNYNLKSNKVEAIKSTVKNDQTGTERNYMPYQVDFLNEKNILVYITTRQSPLLQLKILSLPSLNIIRTFNYNEGRELGINNFKNYKNKIWIFDNNHRLKWYNLDYKTELEELNNSGINTMLTPNEYQLLGLDYNIN